MAHSPFSLNLQSTNTYKSPLYNSLYRGLLLQHQTHSLYLNKSTTLKTSTSSSSCCYCCYHPTKSKRKPRPSFYEQIRDKWSLKRTSTRENFPWQVQEGQQQQQQQQKQKIEEEEEDVKREIKVDVSEPVSFSVSDRFVPASWINGKNPTKSQVDSNPVFVPAPWIHGKKHTKSQVDSNPAFVPASWIHGKNPTKSQVVSNPEILQIGCNDKIGDKTDDGFERNCENNVRDTVVIVEEEEVKNVEKEVTSVEIDVKNAEKEVTAVKIDATSIELDKEKAIVVGSLNGGVVLSNEKSIRLPWEREVEGEKGKRSNTELAERMVPAHELQRLRKVSLRMFERTKVGAAGITQALVDSIHEKWKVDEVIKLKFEGPLSINMKRTHEVLESRTGGLVIWRSGSSVVLFRGLAYKLHCVQSYTKQDQRDKNVSPHSKDVMTDATHNAGVKDSIRTTESFIPDSAKYMNDLSKEELMDLCELNHLLDELGPRFKDWSGREPLPVDADLLPAVVPGYKTPFRLLPYGIKPRLRNKETTIFRRLARSTAPHFALGRNRELQGLAKAMVKLWERSAIAKIAIKRGVENTRNDRMAEELRKLTGGTLLSRNKEYIVFYRGNDFLPSVVTEALKERLKLTDLQQNEEELARQTASVLIASKAKASKAPLVAGTLSETIAATSRWGQQPSNEDVEEMMRDSALTRQTSLVRYLEKKLALAKGKLTKAEKALAKVQKSLEPAELPTDLEAMTDEERFLFRKIGLSMKPYLLLGRREVFDGTIENMHLHWKYRELVKIIVRGKNFAQVKHIAISLEAESGGVLVSVDKTTKGYAIIVYRGKNYLRPRAIRPKNLLTRRQALARSIELQRREALKHHISDSQERIKLLKSELEQMKAGKNIDAEKTLCSRVDDAYFSNDDIEEEEGEEAYLQTYDSSNDDSSNLHEDEGEEAYLQTYDSSNDDSSNLHEDEREEAYLQTYDSSDDDSSNPLEDEGEDVYLQTYDSCNDNSSNAHEEF